MHMDEQVASKGLDIILYAGKWKRAKSLAESTSHHNNSILLPYWDRVRLLFLELGGEYKKDPE